MQRAWLLVVAGLAGCAGPLASSLQAPLARPPQQAVLAMAEVADWNQDLRRTLEKSLRRSPILAAVRTGPDASVRLELDAGQVFVAHSAQLRLVALSGLAEIAEAFERHPGSVLHVLVSGSADADLEAPLRLAARQAASLEREFLEAGMAAERLRTEVRDLPAGAAAGVLLEFRPVTGTVPTLAWMPPAP